MVAFIHIASLILGLDCLNFYLMYCIKYYFASTGIATCQ